MYEAEKGHIINKISCTILGKIQNIIKFVVHIIAAFLCSTFKGTNRLASAVAILNPVQVHHAERGWCNSRGPVVVVFVNV